MMTQMVADVMAFIFLIVIFLFGYGVALQGILNPLTPLDNQTGENIIFRPYFNIFGELFLEDFEEESNCIGPWYFSSCGWTRAWLVPLLMALYILVTNILLINLLIAQFNDTYNKVSDDSQRLWNKQNYGQ